MFTIRKQSERRRERRFLKCFRGTIGIVAFVFVATPFAQFGIEENGYLFMHPYFEGTAWNATNYISNVLPDIEMCLDKPVNATVGKLASEATFVYTVTDGTLKMINGLFENNDCPCCRPGVSFDPPFNVALPTDLDLQTELPFYLLGRGDQETDTAYLCVVGVGNTVYCLHISSGSGAVEAVDTITIPDPGTSELTGVWGDGAAGANDTAIWIGGSEGLLVEVPFDDGEWGTPTALTGPADETVTAVGGGYVGMLSGALYQRTGGSITATGTEAAGALRQVNEQVAVGDNGAVLVNRGGAWQDQSSGSVDYRLGNLTANGDGAVVELVDDAWNYSTLQLSDAPTDIEKVTDEAMVGLNVGIYDYGIEGVSDTIKTISVYLRDADGNRSIPTVQLRGRTATEDIEIALAQQTPTAICSTEQAYFNDTLIDLVLDIGHFEIEAEARGGTFDASCRFSDWDYYTYSQSHTWITYDTLLVAAGGDTLRILNNADSQVTVVTRNIPRNRQLNDHTIVSCQGRTVHIVPAATSDLRRVILVDAAGRCVWRHTRSVVSGTVLRSPQLRSGIHFLRVEYADGKIESRRLVLFGR